MLRCDQQIKAAAGHRFNLDLPWDNGEFQSIAISFVREPIEQLISSYYYSKKAGIASPVDFGASFEDYVRRHAADSETWPQTQFSFLSANGKIDLAKMQSLVTEGKLLLCPSERMNEGCLRLQMSHPQDFRDASVRDLNVNAKKPTKGDRNIAMSVKDSLASEYALYELAHASIDTFIRDVNPLIWRNSLRKFHRKTWIRNHIKGPFQDALHRAEKRISRI